MSRSSVIASLIFALIMTACAATNPGTSYQPPESSKPDRPPDRQTAPAATPNPDPVDESRYRVLCEFASLGQVAYISSRARSADSPDIAYLGEPSFEGEVITRENSNLRQVKSAVGVFSSRPNELRMIVSARKLTGVASAAALYFGKVDLAVEAGPAKKLGNTIEFSKDVSELASRLGIHPRNVGVSDRGSYLIVPKEKRFDILRTSDLAIVGRINLDPTKTLDPRLYETQRVISALVYDGSIKAFAPTLIDVQITASGVLLAGVRAIPKPTKGLTAVSLQRSQLNEFGWAEVSREGKTEIAPSEIALVSYDLSSQVTKRASYKVASGTKVFPQLAITRDLSGQIIWHIAQERIVKSSQGVSVEESKLIQLVKNEGLLVLKTLEYPYAVHRQLSSRGLQGEFAIKSLFSADLGSVAFATMTTDYGEQIFKERGGGLDAVGFLSCARPTVVEEG